MLVEIPLKMSVLSFMGFLKGKSSLISFGAVGINVNTEGKNAKKITEYIQNQLKEDQIEDQMTIKEYIDPFTGGK